jgi:hypothetical protein
LLAGHAAGPAADGHDFQRMSAPVEEAVSLTLHSGKGVPLLKAGVKRPLWVATARFLNAP